MSIGSYIDEINKEYNSGLEISSKRLYDILLRELAQHTDSGTLRANEQRLAQLDSIIKEALKQSGYSKSTDAFFLSFGRIDTYNDKYYSAQDMPITKALSESKYIPFLKETVIDTLRGAGAKEGIIKPLENLLKQEIFLNKTYKEAADLLKIQLVDKPLLVRHAGTMATDALFKYNGAINQAVGSYYNLKYFFYIGSEIEATRPICDHIRDNFKGSISTDQLKVILDEYCPDGKPSEKMITYETVNGVVRTLKKGSGMYEGTTVDNFCINCGGYNCRHEVKWTRFPK